MCSSIGTRRTTATRTTQRPRQAPPRPTRTQRRATSTTNMQRTRSPCPCLSLCRPREHRPHREMLPRRRLLPPSSSPPHPWYVSVSDPLTVLKQPPPPGAVETMPGDLAMGKTLAKGPSFDRLSIIPKDVPLAEAIKSPRKTHSSRFHPTERRELEKLPSLHGSPSPANHTDNRRPDKQPAGTLYPETGAVQCNLRLPGSVHGHQEQGNKTVNAPRTA